MKLFLLLHFIASVLAQTKNCPHSVESTEGSFCVEVHWGSTQRKHRDQWVDSDSLSPWLIESSETVTQKWKHSRAYIQVWKEGDPKRVFAYPNGFRVFPLMQMVGKPPHDTFSHFEYNSGQNSFEISQMTFHEMLGCWSLRWTLSEDNSVEKSKPLLLISKYTNRQGLSAQEDFEICHELSQDGKNSHNSVEHGEHIHRH